MKINPKFESCIPPLTEEEFKQLRDNIVESETIYSPIVIWNDYIVDGHNRYKILQEHPGFMANIFDLSFDYQTEEEVISWICSNQLGRHNLTPEQKKYLVGKQYEAERSMRGGDHCSQKAKSQNEGLLSANASERVAQKIIRTVLMSSVLFGMRKVWIKWRRQYLGPKRKYLPVK